MLEGRTIALVEDDEIMGGSLEQRLRLEGARVVWFKGYQRALGGLRTPHRPFDAVICDIRLGDGSGEDLFLKLAETTVPPPFLFMTGQASADQAVRLLRSGAADYLTKPFDMGQLLERLSLLIAPGFEGDGPEFGPSKPARQIDEMIVRLAQAEGPVLILGESGTGKRAAAERLHARSERSAAPFISVDLSRIAGDQHAARLFDQGGAMEQAGQGIVLLERLGEASDAVQAQLLTSIWEAGRDGMRLVATEDNNAHEKLRPDLYFHLSPLTLTIPPLRERPEDALWMMTRMFDGMNRRRDKPLKGISTQAEAIALRHDWRGNGREIRARLAQAMALAQGDMIMPADLFPDMAATSETAFATLAEARDQAERVQIQRALDQCAGSMMAAAKLLGVGRTTLWEKMQKLGIARPDEDVRKPEQGRQ
ncbi:sigma-54-dependent transcriptional regulator [Roseinatronobacter monicus]|uniref:DNA-binding NtrC family response regulator n=1 Tax=Roseinatronobacter monicus TaxID=393481 RepID=A0A543K367_9RHOB|nr:response regulator [Roseinatronobacter monicus]TQM89505.1 DNA-binding NtrC family response regulator [Roseinatronobacter monicus]